MAYEEWARIPRPRHLDFALVCAVLMRESGGRSLFGHDPTIFVGAGTVTVPKYRAYVQLRDRLYVERHHWYLQGVGPCQLTAKELQDEADRLGGCWRPAINMRVGFRFLAGLIRENGLERGVAAYNGSEAYAREVLASRRTWERLLGGAGAVEIAGLEPA